jgi:hypothetical protein
LILDDRFGKIIEGAMTDFPDAERELLIERLRQATAEGRLSFRELEQRVGQALVSRTYRELNALLVDLPGPRITEPGTPSTSSLRAKLAGVAVAGVIAIALLADLAPSDYYHYRPVLPGSVHWGSFGNPCWANDGVASLAQVDDSGPSPLYSVRCMDGMTTIVPGPSPTQ